MIGNCLLAVSLSRTKGEVNNANQVVLCNKPYIEGKRLNALHLFSAASIRPSNKDEDYQTPFTRIGRHTYVDYDYGFTKKEEEKRREHRNKYKTYLQEQAQKRRDKEATK